jgi:stage III sporulation protein AD
MVLPALIASGVLIITLVLPYLSETIFFIKEIYSFTGLDNSTLKIIIKITGIAFLVEIGSGFIEDMGLRSTSDKLAFAGKIIILSVSMPIFYALLNLVKGLIQ